MILYRKDDTQGEKTMDYVEELKKQYIKNGETGFNIRYGDYSTVEELRKQGFEEVGGFSEYAYENQYRNSIEEIPENERGYWGDFKGQLKINQIKYRIDDIHTYTLGSFFLKREVSYYKDIVFENKSMDIDEIEKAYMWFESFKVYNGYKDITEEFHDMLYEKLIKTGKYKTRDYKRSLFD